jgi:hypothetical protein
MQDPGPSAGTPTSVTTASSTGAAGGGGLMSPWLLVLLTMGVIARLRTAAAHPVTKRPRTSRPWTVWSLVPGPPSRIQLRAYLKALNTSS